MYLKIIYLLALLFLFSSCSALKASPAERAGFIPNVLALDAEKEATPFHGVWYKNKKYFCDRRDEIEQIVILPVRVDYLGEKGWWSRLNSLDSEVYRKDIKELSQYFRDSLKQSFSNVEDRNWQVFDTPSENSLIVEFALTEVVATKAHINAIASTAGFFIPGAGLLATTGAGSIAFEAKIYDGRDGELLLAYSDREADKYSLASLKDFQYYAHARQIIKEWSEQFVKLTSAPKGSEVEDSLPFSLNPF